MSIVVCIGPVEVSQAVNEEAIIDAEFICIAN